MAKTFDKNGAIIRSRNWFLVSYLSMEAITEYCKMGHISRFAFIKHDKDVYDKTVLDNDGNIVHNVGDLKEPHIHLLVVYKNARTRSAVLADFANREQNTLVEQCIELDSAFDYLTHRRNPEKIQYDEQSIICDDLSYWQSLARGEEDNTATQLIADILSGKNPVYLLKRYGRDFVLNHQKYYQFAENVGTINEDEFDTWQAKRLAEEEKKALAFREFIDGQQECPFDEDYDLALDDNGHYREPIYFS